MSPDYTLYYVLDVPTRHDPVELAREAVIGGASAVQLRGKRSTALELCRLAAALKEVLLPLGAPLIVDDRLDVALATGADGVHLGESDLPFERARDLAPDLILGVSCYGDLGRAHAAVEAGADYLAFGAFFPSPSKPDAKVVPLSVLSDARRLGKPVVAIGGIRPDTVPDLLAAGADGIAVISAIQGSADPREAAHALRVVVDASKGTGEENGRGDV